MFKYFAAFRKEWLILIRDIAGLIILFLMPMVMVIILALVQELGWNAITSEPIVPVLFVDEDRDSLGSMVRTGLRQSGTFQIITEIDSTPLTVATTREMIRRGQYQIGVVIPKGSTQRINQKVELMVTKIISGIMMPMNNPFLGIEQRDSIQVTVYFDPAVRGAFKNTFMSSIREYTMKIEYMMIFRTFNRELMKLFPQYHSAMDEYRQTVTFREVFPSGHEEESIPTTTQHNVPSWAIFAMFFIVIPLSSTIIREREEGSMVRLLTMPVSYLSIFMAKVGVYLIVCFIQFMLMILSGIFILPLFGIPPLETGTNYLGIILMIVATSLAALGYAIMIGTIARTHQQAAAFGSVSVVILAAIGGLWVPTYFFTDGLKQVASCSPLNWAHVGFLDLFLRSANLRDILPALFKLGIFFITTIAIASIYRTIKPPLKA
jgi:ABC-2 type transport system permease protein